MSVMDMSLESRCFILMAILLALFQAFSCFSAGALILLRRQYLITESPVFFVFRADTALCFALGMGIYSLAYLLLALCSVFFLPVVVGINIAAIFIFLMKSKEWSLGSINESLKSVFLPLSENVLFKIILLASAFLLLTSTPRILIQPLTGDCLVYYYAQAKLIAYLHTYKSIHSFEHMGNTIPFVFEMIFSAFYLYGGGVAGQYASKIFCFISFFFSLTLLYHLIREMRISAEYGIFAVLILITSSAIVTSLSSGKPDIPSLLVSIAAIYTVVKLKTTSLDTFHVAITAFFTATACLGKFSSLSQVTLIVFCIYLAKRHQFIKHIGKEAFWGAFVFLITLFLGWNLKNMLVGGEPLGPFISIYNSPGFNAVRQVWNTPEATKHILMIYPLAIVFGNFFMQEGGMSSLLCVSYIFFFGSLLISAKLRYSKVLIALFAGSSLGLLIWLLTNPSVLAPRYIYPVILGFMICAGPAFDFIWQHKKLFVCKVCLIFVITILAYMNYLILQGYSTLYLTKNPLHYETPLGFTQAAAIVNKDKRPDLRLRCLTSFFEPFDGRLLSTFKVLQVDTSLIPNNSIGILKTSEFWENIKKEKIDYIFTWHSYFIYPKVKYLLELSDLPPGLSVTEMRWEAASLFIISRDQR